ncbi:very short patch repair endonuclease [Burkholderia ubonensis]|uniref:very short patch repair endonuclease n=1 Tax=Burkholderia ubonensis TaxID=101571 RepID=UPI0009B3FADE
MQFFGTTTPERSKLMSSVRSKSNLTTELRLVEILRSHRLVGWRRHSSIFGHPDFVFRKQRTAIFVDGCFWHGCPRCYRSPRTNPEFWAKKVSTNRARDRQVNAHLRSHGWCVLRIWEHSLRNDIEVTKRIKRALNRHVPPASHTRNLNGPRPNLPNASSLKQHRK